MFVAVTNDGGFYSTKDEDEAVKWSEHFEIDFNDWAFNVFEVNESEVYFTGIAHIHDSIPKGVMIDGLFVPNHAMFGYKNIGDVWKNPNRNKED